MQPFCLISSQFSTYNTMERDCMQKLETWKANPRRKPLLLLGARQVGKTWLAQAFAKKHYQTTAYVRFDKSPALRASFEQDCDVKRLIADIQLTCGVDVHPEKTLIILDEIQECSAALMSLKYFCEEAREYHIIAAGSLLGVELNQGVGFPVGKVDRLMLHPLSYTEFLNATGHGRFVELLRQGDWETMMRFRSTYETLLRNYYYIGGMPEVVDTYLATEQYTQVRQVQTALLADYRADFAKHTSAAERPRLSAVWDSVPVQLAENRRFILAKVAAGAKSAAYRSPIQWLKDAGLMHSVYNVKQAQIPLSANCTDEFRLYPLDVGLLAAQSGLDSSAIVEKNAIFKQYKGALTEQYVHQQVLAEYGKESYCWLPEKSEAEIEFLLESARGIVPLEAKAEQNRRAKSLLAYCRRFHPHKLVRTSMGGYSVNSYTYLDSAGLSRECPLVDLPLFGISRVMEEVEGK